MTLLMIATLICATSSLAVSDTVKPSGFVVAPRIFSIAFRNSMIDSRNELAPARISDLIGFAYDDDSGVESVRVQVSRCSSGNGVVHYWNGVSWQTNPLWIHAFFSSDEWLVPDVDFTQVRIYRVRVRIRDNAGNVADPLDIGVTTIKSVVDTVDPTGRLLSPDAFQIITPGVGVEEPGTLLPMGWRPITLRATDDLIGVQSVFVQVLHFDSDEFWNGMDWQTDPIWLRTIAFGNFSSTWTTINDVNFNRVGDYSVRMSIRDYADNVADTTENQKTIFRVIEDTEAPTGWTLFPNIDRIRFPDGRVRILRRTVSPRLSRFTGGADDNGTGVDCVRVQIERRAVERDYWNGVAWQPSPFWVRASLLQTETALKWRVFEVDMFDSGEYVVRVSVFDQAGNRSRAQENPITFMIVP